MKELALGAMACAAGYLLKQQEWRSYQGAESGGADDLADRRLPVSLGAAGDQAAKWAADAPGVVATAVLDLYSGDEPAVLKWYVNDGKGTKAFDKAPRADLDASLRAYLLSLQANQP